MSRVGDTLPVALGASEKSFFESKLGLALTKGLPAIPGLYPMIKVLMFGVEEPKEQTLLRDIYGQLGELGATLRGVSANVVYTLDTNNIKRKVEDIHIILSNQTVNKLTESQLKILCEFLTPGLSEGYRSLISTLIRSAYGVELSKIIDARADNPVALGASQSAAYNLNASLLSKSIGIHDYVSAHVNFALEVSTLILSVCLAANDAHKFLSDNESAIHASFGSRQVEVSMDTVTKVIRNETVLREISNIQSESFLSTRITPSVATAPANLCGIAYKLVAAMTMNAEKPGSANNNISISREEGDITSQDNLRPFANDMTYGYELGYNSASKYWAMSFSNNNTPSNFVNIAGRHGGFLGMAGDGRLSYVYEVTGAWVSRKDEWVGEVRPTHDWNRCIWEMKVRKDKANNMVFMFVNKEFQNVALANNHGFLMPTKPGHYRFEEDNNDEYWTVKLS